MIGSRIVRSDCGMNFSGAAAAPREMDGAANAAPTPAVNVRRRIIVIPPKVLSRFMRSSCHGTMTRECLFQQPRSRSNPDACRLPSASPVHRLRPVAAGAPRQQAPDRLISNEMLLLQPILALHFVKSRRRPFKHLGILAAPVKLVRHGVG